MLSAVRALRRQDPASITVAVPVASASASADLEREADLVICASTPEPMDSVGAWYESFGATEDDEVRQLLAAPGPQEHLGRP
jgi:predicted phosphoribosyltransferase